MALKYDCYECAANLIESHIIFYNLPGPIKKELINMSDSFYPGLAKIFKLVPKVIDKINIIAGHGPNYPKETIKKSKATTEIQSDPDNVKPFIGVNTVASNTPAANNQKQKQNNRGKYRQFIKIPCKFCESMDHPAKHCPKFPTKEARLKILLAMPKNKDHGLCNTCTRWEHIGDPCIQKYLCKCGVGNQHHTTLCPEALAKSLKSSLNSDPITCQFTAFEPATPDHDTGI